MWQELLAGLAGGAQGATQGLGQIQDMRQQQLQNQLRERQQKLADDQARRQAVEQAWNTLQGGHQFEDPSQAQQFVELGYGVIKGPDGRPMKPKSPDDLLRDKQIKVQDLEIADRERTQGVLAGLTPDVYTSKSIPERMVLNTQLTGKFDPTTPDEDTRNSTQVAVAGIRAQADAARASQSASIAQQRLDLARSAQEFAKSQAMNAQQFKALMASLDNAQTQNPYADNAKIWASALDMLGRIQGQLPQAPQAGQPAQQPAGTTVKTSRGVYQVQY